MHTPTLALCLFALFALAHATSMPEEKCWTETRKCRYVAVAAGYECKDYYSDKYARCHPKMRYRKKCDKPVYSPELPTKPAEYIDWEQSQSTIVDYDKNYGPHVEGYPHTDMSDYYYSKELPTKPYGVTEDAFAPPTGNVAPGEPDYVMPPKTGTQKPTYTAPPTSTEPPAPMTSANNPPAYTSAPEATHAPAPAYTEAPAPMTSSNSPPAYTEQPKATEAPAPQYTSPPHAPAPATSGSNAPKYY